MSIWRSRERCVCVIRCVARVGVLGLSRGFRRARAVGPFFIICKKLVHDDGGAAASGLVADLFSCMVSNALFWLSRQTSNPNLFRGLKFWMSRILSSLWRALSGFLDCNKSRMIQLVDKLQPGFQRRLHKSSNLAATIVDLVGTVIYKFADSQ